MKPKISVIIPVYNSGKTIDRCLSSIVNQSYKNIEIVCVNDGSMDNSIELLKKWKDKDSRVIVIDKANGGVSSARNQGLNMASGEYVAFVDSDDYIASNMYECLQERISLCNSDCAVCQVYNVFANDVRPSTHVFANSIIGGGELIKNLVDAVDSNLLEGPCNKLYKMSIIRDNKLSFNERLSFAEDWLFNINFYKQAKDIAFTTDFLYYYDRTTEGSLSKKYRSTGLADSIFIRKELVRLFPDKYSREVYFQKLFLIQDHYIRLYASTNGYNGLMALSYTFFRNEDLKDAHLHALSIPKSQLIANFAFKHNMNFLFLIHSFVIAFIPNLKRFIKIVLKPISTGLGTPKMI